MKMPSPARILVYGEDSTLLETRRMVFEHSGFEVTVARNLETVESLLAAHTFDVFVLCHSLSSSNCESAVALTHALRTGMKNLILSTAFSTCLGSAGDATLSALSGPRVLVQTVREIACQPTRTLTF